MDVSDIGITRHFISGTMILKPLIRCRELSVLDEPLI